MGGTVHLNSTRYSAGWIHLGMDRWLPKKYSYLSWEGRKQIRNWVGSFSFPLAAAGKSELKGSNFLLHKTGGVNLIFSGTYLKNLRFKWLLNDYFLWLKRNSVPTTIPNGLLYELEKYVDEFSSSFVFKDFNS